MKSFITSNNTLKILFYSSLICFFVSCKEKEKSEPNVDYGEEIQKALKPEKFDKLGLVYEHPENHTVDQYEVYVSDRSDTIFNQMKRVKDGELDLSASKFYILDLKDGENDSIMKGSIRIFSPDDTIPTSRLQERHVILKYLQRVQDTIEWKEIETDSNNIEFDFTPFNDRKFMGFVADYRYFKVDSSDNYLLIKNFYAIDTEDETENPFIPILMEQNQKQ